MVRCKPDVETQNNKATKEKQKQKCRWCKKPSGKKRRQGGQNLLREMSKWRLILYSETLIVVSKFRRHNLALRR